MSWKKATVEIRGVAPYVQHNGDLANPLSQAAKRMKEIASKRKKTDADFEELAKREFFGSMYVDDGGNVVVPAAQLIATIIEGAKKNRQGKEAASGVVVTTDSLLRFKDEGKAVKLWPSHGLTVGVRVQRNRVMRTRPIFREWSTKFEIEFDPKTISESGVQQAIEKAGELVGIGDWRPRFGRFEVVRFE